MFQQDATSFAIKSAEFGAGRADPMSGLTAATLVETTQGWRAAADLMIGSMVYTIEGGIRPVLAIDRKEVPAGTTFVRLAGGTFDNCSTLDLLPEQDVVLDRRNGTPIRVPARMLAGHRGASLVCAARAVEIVTPLFAEDEVIWTNSGTRLYCSGIGSGVGSGAAGGFIPRVHGADADDLIVRILARRVA
jgi:Hint domain